MKKGTDYIGVGLGAFIFNDAGEVFLMKRSKHAQNEAGTWMLPGGSLEYGETLREGIMREVMEEVGVAIEITGQLPAFDHILREEGQHWVTNIFTARIIDGEAGIMEPDKCDEVGWFALADLPTPIAQASQGAFDYFIGEAL